MSERRNGSPQNHRVAAWRSVTAREPSRFM